MTDRRRSLSVLIMAVTVLLISGVLFFVASNVNSYATGSYTVTWKNDDGTVLETDENVEEGVVPEYNGATPQKASTAQYDYSFKGWNPSVKKVTGDVVYMASYDSTVRKYTVTWKNYDDTVLQTDEDVPYGTTPEYTGTEPTKAEASFSHWEDGSGNPVGPISGDTVYTAQFTNAAAVIVIQDKVSKDAISGARFELRKKVTDPGTSQEREIVVWRGTSSAAGILNIPQTESDTELTGDKDGGGAAFANGSTYLLYQTDTDAAHIKPSGHWKLEVSSEGVFSMSKVADASDLSTQKPLGPYGIRFYLFNVKSSSLTYDYNYPEGVSGQPPDVTKTLSELSYDVRYTIDINDPSLEGYEFAGWSVNGSSQTAKKGDTVSLDTVNVSNHSLKAMWRSPLTFDAVLHANNTSTPVDGSSGIYRITQERSISFASLRDTAEKYGGQNDAVAGLNARSDIEVSYAVLTTADKREIRVTSVRYNASEHSWQYRMADGATNWINTSNGDRLTLHYVTNQIGLKWVAQAADGSFTELKEGQAVNIGSDWTAVNTLIDAADRPVIMDEYYFASYGAGALDASSAAQLEKSGLTDFAVKNSENGFYIRTGTSGEGEKLTGDTIYLVYSEEPPEGSACLDIENYSNKSYKLNRIYINSQTDSNDLLKNGKVILKAGDGKLSVLGPDAEAGASSKLSLVLLGGGTSNFIIPGTFEGHASADYISVGIITASGVKRTAITGEALSNTSEWTIGTLEGLEGTVRVTLDSDLSDYTIKKEWNDVPDKDSYTAGFKLFEAESIGTEDDEGEEGEEGEDSGQTTAAKRCITSDNPSGIYTANKSSSWEYVIHNLPSRCIYTVEESSVTQGGEDKTNDFIPSYEYGDRTATVTNASSKPVCRVGNEQFTTIKAAVRYITDNSKTTAEIWMIDDYFMSESGAVTIPEGYNITLRTDESFDKVKTITRGFAGDNDMFLVKGSLKLGNVKIDGKINNDTWYIKEGSGGLITVDAGGSLTAGAGTEITRGRSSLNGSAIYVKAEAGGKHGEVTLDGAKITDCRAGAGGAIGFADESARINLKGNTVVYNNRDENGNGQYNIHLNKDSNEIIKVLNGGLGDDAKIGIYVTNGDGNAQINAHGKPAKPFAKYDDGGNVNLDKLICNRISSSLSNYGSDAAPFIANTIIWGELFSFESRVQWMNAEFNVIGAPSGAASTLSLSGGSLVPSASVVTEQTLNGSEGWKVKFTGLARYDENGKPYKYRVSESSLAPDDYKQIIFTGDKGTEDNPLTYDPKSGDSQTAVISNYYKYTKFTVKKVVATEGQGLKSTFTLYRIPKDRADLRGSIRKYGVGGVSDLPNSLRDTVPSEIWNSVSELSDDQMAYLAKTDLFFTVDGGNSWYMQLEAVNLPGSQAKLGIDSNLSSTLVRFHKFYDNEILTDMTKSGTLLPVSFTYSDVEWQAGDVVRFDGICYVYNGSEWINLGEHSAPYIYFDRQDGNTGVDSAGGESTGLTCTIDGTGSYTFKVEDKKLLSDYYYYAVETTIQETNGQNRTITTYQSLTDEYMQIPSSHRIVATYDPKYEYVQKDATETVTNTRQDFLSVDKLWSEDAVNKGECIFDIYEIDTVGEGSTSAYLSNATNFRNLVTGTAGRKVGEFRLPEDNGSWVHVIKTLDNTETGEVPDINNKIYFVRERSAGGVTILNPDVSESSVRTDAAYSYEGQVNQITVKNLSDVLCKITDSDGEHPFRTLNDALQYGRTRDNGDSNTKFTIMMLRDYTIPQSDIMKIKAGEKIGLTTAEPEGTAGVEYCYKGAEGRTKATITRKSDNKLPFVIVNGDSSDVSATSFTLSNIELDGAGVAVSGRTDNKNYYNGSFVNAAYATVILKKDSAEDSGVVMRNATASNGGAVYAANSAVDISNTLFTDCRTSDSSGNDTTGGGAVWTSGDSTVVKDSVFRECSSKRHGGAIASVSNSASSSTLLENCEFTKCEASFYGGGVFSRNHELTAGGDSTDKTCVFGSANDEDMRCTAVYGGAGIMHRNTAADTTTTVKKCSFYFDKVTGGNGDNTAMYGGGGLNSHAEKLYVNGCLFEQCTSYSRGGGIVHGEAKVKTAASISDIRDCVFNKCESVVSGGGGMHITGVTDTIERCTFTDCRAAQSAGGGLDIGCFDIDKDATVTDCSFTNCTAGNANGGGICAGGKMLTVSKSSFVNCTATTQHGGGISFSAGGSSEECNIYGCSFKECTAPANNGGAVYSLCVLTRIADYTDGTHTVISDCNSKNAGGAVYQNKNSAGSQMIVQNASFTECRSTNSSGGSIYTNARKLSVTGNSEDVMTTFTDSTAQTYAGAVFHDNSSSDTESHIENCSFVNTEAKNNEGGAIYTKAVKVELIKTDFNDPGYEDNGHSCKAKGSGGAVFHNNNTELSSFTCDECSFYNCSTTNGNGGAVLTYATKLKTDDTVFAECRAKASAGAVYQGVNGSFVTSSEAVFTDCTFTDTEAGTNDTGARGGAIYSSAQTLTVQGVAKTSEFNNTCSTNIGGAICHDRNNEFSKTVIKKCSFDTSTSKQNAGGVLASYATGLEFEDVSVNKSTSRYSGGAIYHSVNGNYTDSSYARIKNSDFTTVESTSGNAGVIYTNSLTLTADNDHFKDCSSWQYGGCVFHDNNRVASFAAFTDCSFEDCECVNHEGGALWIRSTTLTMTSDTIKNCKAKTHAGAAAHWVSNDQASGSSTHIENCSFDDCTAVNNTGGALIANTTTLTLKKTAFSNCSSGTSGGAVRHDRASVAASVTVDECSFSSCTSGGEGGALYTNATGLAVRDTEFRETTAASNGGAIMHWIAYDSTQLSTSAANITTSSFDTCTSQNQWGGAIRSNALVLTAIGTADKRIGFKDCNSKWGGGAIYHGRTSAGGKTEIQYCDFSGCSSSAANNNNEFGGGAVNTSTVQLIIDNSSFSKCSAKNKGGCLLHYVNSNIEVTTDISNSSFTGGTVTERDGNGGAIYLDESTAVIKNTTISGSSASNSGGGIYQNNNKYNRPLCLENCSITGNSAGNCGGGIYFRPNSTLTLCSGTSVTGNSITSSAVDNAAGIYMYQNNDYSQYTDACLVMGKDGVDEDTITVYNNMTSGGSGEQSNLRLIKSNKKDNASGRYNNRDYSIRLYSDLVKTGTGATGTIGVTDPGAAGTQFGIADIGNRRGINNIRSDIDTLYGIIDPSDTTRTKLIWYAPPICKITSADGGLPLKFENDKTAAFTSLKEAVSVLNAGGLYFVDQQGNKTYPEQFQIQMLVPDYQLNEDLQDIQRSVTLTTADPGTGEYDYPLNATSDTAAIVRGPKAKGSMLTVASGISLTVTDITLDGGSRTAGNLTSNSNGGIIYGKTGSSVTLRAGSVLQNSDAGNNNGGAVYISGGADGNSLVMNNNSIIRNCSAKDGGGVYLTGDATFLMNDLPQIVNCTASRYGGAVYVSPHAEMRIGDNPYPVITGNRITDPSGAGAGIYLPNNDSKLYLKLGRTGRISDNYVEGTEDPSRTVAGNPYNLLRQDIYLGESRDPVTSIVLTGQIRSGEGSIWVYAEKPVHYRQEMQFAIIEKKNGKYTFTPLAATLKAFYNARGDDDTENQTDEYIYGIRGEGANVVWSISANSIKVILRKIGNNNEPLSGAKMTVYKGNSTSPYIVKHKDAANEVLEDLVSGSGGIFWIGMLPYGTYEIHETRAPSGYSDDRWFTLDVSEDGTECSAARKTR